MPKSQGRTSRFILEIFSIFLGVTIAFLANHWNEQRKERILEEKILQGIYDELEADMRDIENNIRGHELCINAIHQWTRFIEHQPVDFDSLGLNFSRLYRDYISVANTSAYETLKSRGLEVVSNDELRSRIVALYDFNYELTQKLEEVYYPGQFHKNYFEKITSHFKEYLIVENNQIKVRKSYTGAPDTEIMLILKEILDWRLFTIRYYKENLETIHQLRKDIKSELGT